MIQLYFEYLSVRDMYLVYTGLYLIITSSTSFRVNPNFIVCLNVKELLARRSRYIWNLSDLLARSWDHIGNLSDSNGIRTQNNLVRKRKLNHLTKMANWLKSAASAYLYGAFDSMVIIMSRMSFRVNPESVVCLNVKEHLARSSRHIRSLSKNNQIRTLKHL